MGRPASAAKHLVKIRFYDPDVVAYLSSLSSLQRTTILQNGFHRALVVHKRHHAMPLIDLYHEGPKSKAPLRCSISFTDTAVVDAFKEIEAMSSGRSVVFNTIVGNLFKYELFGDGSEPSVLDTSQVDVVPRAKVKDSTGEKKRITTPKKVLGDWGDAED
jgi:hypothetical protein